MKRHVLAALVALALLTLVAPGTVAAAAGGHAAAVEDCRENHADHGFRNVGECVSYVVQGGTLEPTFESVCSSLGGTYIPRGDVLGIGTMANPGCEWAEIALPDLIDAFFLLSPYCTYPATYLQTSYTNGAVACVEFF